ncbi:MAG: hypothetical protein VX593_02650, partial [Pseudomonadota bacterium]|nr:hypothetical protein [Pseudomonadota bacterium]
DIRIAHEIVARDFFAICGIDSHEGVVSHNVSFVLRGCSPRERHSGALSFRENWTRDTLAQLAQRRFDARTASGRALLRAASAGLKKVQLRSIKLDSGHETAAMARRP